MSSYAILVLLCTFSFSFPTYDWGSNESSGDSQESAEPQKEEENPFPVDEKSDEDPKGSGGGNDVGAAAAAAAASATEGKGAAASAAASVSSGKKGKKGRKKKGNKGDGKKEKGKKKGKKGGSSAAAAAASASNGSGKGSSAAAAAAAASGKGSSAAAAAAAASDDDREKNSSEEDGDNEGNGGEPGDGDKENGDEGSGEDEGDNEEQPTCYPEGYPGAAAAAAAALAAGGGLASATASAAVTSQVSFTPFKTPTCPCAPTGAYRSMAEWSYGDGGNVRSSTSSAGVADLELEQYVVSMMSQTGLRLRPANCEGTGEKDNYLTSMKIPDRYNMAQPCELWVFEPYFVGGKRVYQIRNVQRGLYLRASPNLYKKYYHVLGLKPRDKDDMSMYWELTGWSIRNLLYDEYLTHSPRNSSGYGMTYPIAKDMVTWVLTKKSDLTKITSPNRGSGNKT